MGVITGLCLFRFSDGELARCLDTNVPTANVLTVGNVCFSDGNLDSGVAVHPHSDRLTRRIHDDELVAA